MPAADPGGSQAPAEYRNVLVPVDLLAGSGNGLATAARIAPDARITVIHAYDVPFEGALVRAGMSAADINVHRAQAFQKALDAIDKLSESVAGEESLRLIEFAAYRHALNPLHTWASNSIHGHKLSFLPGSFGPL